MPAATVAGLCSASVPSILPHFAGLHWTVPRLQPSLLCSLPCPVCQPSLISSGACDGIITLKKFSGGSFTMDCPRLRAFIAMTSAPAALFPLTVCITSGLALWRKLFWLPLLPACQACMHWLGLTFGLAPPPLASMPGPGL